MFKALIRLIPLGSEPWVKALIRPTPPGFELPTCGTVRNKIEIRFKRSPVSVGIEPWVKAFIRLSHPGFELRTRRLKSPIDVATNSLSDRRFQPRIPKALIRFGSDRRIEPSTGSASCGRARPGIEPGLSRYHHRGLTSKPPMVTTA